MRKENSNNIDSTSQIPLDVQLQLCKEVSLAFRNLCKTVCETFGHEGEKIIRETFLSDSDFSKGDMLQGVENPSKEVGMTLIKLLASWGISGSSCAK